MSEETLNAAPEAAVNKAVASIPESQTVLLSYILEPKLSQCAIYKVPVYGKKEGLKCFLSHPVGAEI